jgi:hypothetical protein
VPIHFAGESFSKTYVGQNGTSDFTVLRARADYGTSVPGGVLQRAESAEFLALRRQQRLVLCQWSSRYVRKIDYRDLDIISSASIRVENRMVNGCQPSTSFSS